MIETESLRSIVKGKILDDKASLEHYSSDGSIFEIKPQAVLLPADVEDIVSLVKWVSEKKGESDSDEYCIMCRGKGSDQAGGPLGKGIIIRFPDCLDKIEEITDGKVIVDPGVICGKLEDELLLRNLFLPPYPASKDFCTIGGMVANNSGGEKSVKYGSTKDYVEKLNVILSNGQRIETSKLNKSQLKGKLAMDDFEGEIYRRIFDLVNKNKEIIASHKPKVNKVSSGYNLWEIMGEDGSFDLTKILVGSQGTLGIIDKITLKVAPKPKYSGLLVLSFNDLDSAGQVIAKSAEFDLSALEMVDKYLLEIIKAWKPELLGIFNGAELPSIVLLAEASSDNQDEIKSVLSAFKSASASLITGSAEAYSQDEMDKLWQIRRSALVDIEHVQGKAKALPFMEDVTVRPADIPAYLKDVYDILNKHGLRFSVYGHAGNGDLHIQPLLDLGDPKDVNNIFSVADEVYAKVAKLGGMASGEHNDGLMRTPYLSEIFGEEIYNLFKEVKKIFDPLDIFNPYKKVGATKEMLREYLRKDYNVHPETENTVS